MISVMGVGLHNANGLKQSVYGKKVREKSRESHNHKPQPFPDPKRTRKPTNPNKHKPNKRTKSTKTSPPPPSPPPPPSTSEAAATPKGPKNTRTKRHTERHTTNRPAEQTTKQQRARPTPGPLLQNGQQTKPPGGPKHPYSQPTPTWVPMPLLIQKHTKPGPHKGPQLSQCTKAKTQKPNQSPQQTKTSTHSQLYRMPE